MKENENELKKDLIRLKKYVVQQYVGHGKYIDLRPDYYPGDIKLAAEHLKHCRDSAPKNTRFRVITRETEIIETEMEW